MHAAPEGLGAWLTGRPHKPLWCAACTATESVKRPRPHCAMPSGMRASSEQLMPKCPDLAAPAAGLLEVSLGISRRHADDDHAMLEAMMPVYFALWAWCVDQVGGQVESHH